MRAVRCSSKSTLWTLCFLWAEFNLLGTPPVPWQVQISKAIVLLELTRLPKYILSLRVHSSSFNERRDREMSKNFSSSWRRVPLGTQEDDSLFQIKWTCSSKNDLWVELIVLTKSTMNWLLLCSFLLGLFLQNYISFLPFFSAVLSLIAF